MVFDPKFPTDDGVGAIHGEQAVGRTYYVAELWNAQRKKKDKGGEGSLCVRFLENWQLTPRPRPERHDQFSKDLDPRDNDDKGEVKEYQASPEELTIDVSINIDDDSRLVKVGSQLHPQIWQELKEFLRTNLDVFAWTHQTCVRSRRTSQTVH